MYSYFSHCYSVNVCCFRAGMHQSELLLRVCNPSFGGVSCIIASGWSLLPDFQPIQQFESAAEWVCENDHAEGAGEVKTANHAHECNHLEGIWTLGATLDTGLAQHYEYDYKYLALRNSMVEVLTSTLFILLRSTSWVPFMLCSKAQILGQSKSLVLTTDI